MDKNSENSRRKFIRNAVSGAFLAAVAPSALKAKAIEAPTILPAGAKGANDRIRVAVLGVNGRGSIHIK